MHAWLTVATEYAVMTMEAMALVIIAVGTIEAFIGAFRVFFQSRSSYERRDVWLRLARWLVAGLTFQLAADIIETSIRTDWQSIGKLGAVALIRTFLNYFLEKDIAEAHERHQPSPPPSTAKVESH